MDTKQVGLCIALISMLLVPSADSQNLIQNPNFDTEIPPWSAFSDTTGMTLWDPFDADGSGSSGSAWVTNFAPDDIVTGAGVRQTIPMVEGGQEYVFDGRVFVASGQARTADVIIELNFYRERTDTGCQNFISPPNVDEHDGTFDTWELLRVVTTAPADAICARLFMATYKHQAGGEFEAYVDNVRLLPASIFADGFESGDLGGWPTQNP